MVSSSLRVGWGIFPLLSLGCFVDAVGLPPAAGGSAGDGGGGSSSNFTGGNGAGAGAPQGGEGGAPQGGEGGAPPPPTCGDGTVVAGEQCEDGNIEPGDGCSASCQFELMCGNSLIEPTEECDPAGPSCTAECKAVAGTACADAIGHQDADTDETVDGSAPGNPFPIPTSAGEWGPFEVCDAVADLANPTNVYRIQIGPYPEGVYLKVHKKGDFDPVLALYKGCGDQPGAPLFCHHADDAFVVSDVVPAGSVMFATVGDRANGGDFDMFMWFHRFWATFDSLSGFFVDPASWLQGVSETAVIGLTDADGAALVSPAIFVGNLDTFEVVAHYGFDDSELKVAVSFDAQGTNWEQEANLANGGYDATKWDRESFTKPADAQFARVRISYISDDPLGRARVLALRVQPVAPFNTW